ncbi:MAG: hypothetical protein JWP16_2299 [Alphaproteobacteria bacterium]|nr:hypothetical protein [Alphaproteobacteria bacterium]MDB5741259.1 hypothetical protein [Alphaproteobacteria bacterium]
MRLRFVISLLLAGGVPAWAQPDAGPGVAPAMASRLAAERVSTVAPGLYSAGDGNFTLEPYGRDKYLLRFPGVAEKFVLSQERSSLGARILKYDTGATALRVSVWGGMTLYTADNPGGIPATRQGDAPAPGPMTVSAGELMTAFGDETHHLTYVQKIAIKFSTDAAVMQADAETRGRAFDALTNAAIGIERFLAAQPVARAQFTKRVNSVKVAEGGKATVTLSGQTLLVSFVPGEGHEGHASSLAVEQELARLLAITPREMATK